MNEITKGWLEKLIKKYPKSSITIKTPFLCGQTESPVGYVPDDWDGTSIEWSVKY